MHPWATDPAKVQYNCRTSENCSSTLDLVSDQAGPDEVLPASPIEKGLTCIPESLVASATLFGLDTDRHESSQGHCISLVVYRHYGPPFSFWLRYSKTPKPDRKQSSSDTETTN